MFIKSNKKKVKNMIPKLVPVNALNEKTRPRILVTSDPIKTNIEFDKK